MPPIAISRGRMFLAYVSGSFGFGIMGMAGFLVPLRAQELGAPLAVIGLIVGAGSLIAMVGSVPAGALTDRIGGRQVYVLSTVLCGVGAVLLAQTDSYWVMLFIELVFGFPRTTVWIASQGYISCVGRPEERAHIAGLFSFSSNVAALGAPLLVGVSAELFGYRDSFWVLVPVAAAYTLIGLALPDVRGVRETPLSLEGEGQGEGARTTAQNHGAALRGFGGYRPAVDLLRLPGIQAAMLLTFVRIWVLVGWFTFFRVYLSDQGFSPLLIGSVEAVSNLLNMIASLAAGFAVRIASKEVATAGALAIAGLGSLISPALVRVPFVYLPGLLVGFGNGLSLPLLLAIIADAVPPERRGLAMGMRTSANRMASAAAPALLGVIMTPLGIPAGLAVGAVAGWAVLALAVWPRSRSLEAPSP